MLCDPSAIKIIKSRLKIPSKAGMRYDRNVEIAKKMYLFLCALRYKNISLACQKLGYKRSYLLTQNSGFYFWFNRLKRLISILTPFRNALEGLFLILKRLLKRQWIHPEWIHHECIRKLNLKLNPPFRQRWICLWQKTILKKIPLGCPICIQSLHLN